MREIIWMRVYKPNLNILELWFRFFFLIVKFPKFSQKSGPGTVLPWIPPKKIWSSCETKQHLATWEISRNDKNKRDSMATDT